jgi:hypothetical protein
MVTSGKQLNSVPITIVFQISPPLIHITSGTGQNPKWNQKQLYPPSPHKFGTWGWEGRVEPDYLGMIFVRDPSQRPAPPQKEKKKGLTDTCGNGNWNHVFVREFFYYKTVLTRAGLGTAFRRPFFR